MANLNEMTSKDLKAMAKDLKVSGWWTMTKAELIAEIEIAQNESDHEEPVEDVVTLEEEEVVTEVTQAITRKNQKRLIEYNGKTQTLTAWAKELGVRHQTLYSRIVLKGWDIDKAFTKGVNVHAEKAETN